MITNQLTLNPFISDLTDHVHVVVPEFVRPIAPFPGQMFSGQKYQEVFNRDLMNLFNTKYLNKYVTPETYSSMIDHIRKDIPNEKLILELIRDHLRVNDFMSQVVLDRLRLDIIKHSYAKINVSPAGIKRINSFCDSNRNRFKPLTNENDFL